jgi:hypothetical protein
MILTRRSFFGAAAAAGVSSPIWAKAITARVSDSQLLTDIEHRTFNFYWERTNHSKISLRITKVRDALALLAAIH